MKFEFTPMSEEEIANSNIVPAGTYEFSVYECVVKEDKNKNPMLVLKIKIENGEYRNRTLRDWVSTSMMHKLKHFCDTLGLKKEYENGYFDPNHLFGKKGKVEIIVQPDRDNPSILRNNVKDYVKPEVKEPIDNFIDDDIGF